MLACPHVQCTPGGPEKGRTPGGVGRCCVPTTALADIPLWDACTHTLIYSQMQGSYLAGEPTAANVNAIVEEWAKRTCLYD
jgi:hypothetical protein